MHSVKVAFESPRFWEEEGIYGGLAWTDRPAISFQFHPEFSPAFAKALIEKRYDRVNDPDAALESLDAPNDSARVAGWMRPAVALPPPAACAG